jgi:hypothetical protein
MSASWRTRLPLGIPLALALAGCGPSSSSPSTSASTSPTTPATTSAASSLPPTSTTAAPSTSVVDEAGCPIDDVAACAMAVEVLSALAAGDAPRLVAASSSTSIVCAEMAREYFPGCATSDVLDGFGVSGPDLLVRVLTEAEYAVELTTFAAEIGTVGPIGVGSCGPDRPGRRSYHVAWLAETVATERVLGSFELTYDDEWSIGLWYVGTLAAWEAMTDDPLRDSFCEAGRSPWR